MSTTLDSGALGDSVANGKPGESWTRLPYVGTGGSEIPREVPSDPLPLLHDKVRTLRIAANAITTRCDSAIVLLDSVPDAIIPPCAVDARSILLGGSDDASPVLVPDGRKFPGQLAAACPAAWAATSSGPMVPPAPG